MDHDASFCEAWDFMEEMGIATADELALACCLCGHRGNAGKGARYSDGLSLNRTV